MRYRGLLHIKVSLNLVIVILYEFVITPMVVICQKFYRFLIMQLPHNWCWCKTRIYHSRHCSIACMLYETCNIPRDFTNPTAAGGNWNDRKTAEILIGVSVCGIVGVMNDILLPIASSSAQLLYNKMMTEDWVWSFKHSTTAIDWQIICNILCTS